MESVASAVSSAVTDIPLKHVTSVELHEHRSTGVFFVADTALRHTAKSSEELLHLVAKGKFISNLEAHFAYSQPYYDCCYVLPIVMYSFLNLHLN